MSRFAVAVLLISVDITSVIDAMTRMTASAGRPASGIWSTIHAARPVASMPCPRARPPAMSRRMSHSSVLMSLRDMIPLAVNTISGTSAAAAIGRPVQGLVTQSRTVAQKVSAVMTAASPPRSGGGMSRPLLRSRSSSLNE